MSLPRKLFWLILAAVPTLLFVGVALWLLLQFLKSHDRLGHWHLHLRDEKGTEIAHGDLDLVATAWGFHCDSDYPFATFDPQLDDHAGHLVIEPAARVGLAPAGETPWPIGTCAFIEPMLSGETLDISTSQTAGANRDGRYPRSPIDGRNLPAKAAMILPRKIFWLVIAAIPTLLLATAAAYILIRFLTVRDSLGTWVVSVRDDYGAEVGHGTIVLVAESWTAHWARSAPFVDFEPTVHERAGTFMPAPAMIALLGLGNAHIVYEIRVPTIMPTVTGHTYVRVQLNADQTLELPVKLHSDRPVPIERMMWWRGNIIFSLPFVVTITRPPAHGPPP